MLLVFGGQYLFIRIRSLAKVLNFALWKVYRRSDFGVLYI